MAHAVAAWALEWGEHSGHAIALCGYEGEHTIPASMEGVRRMEGGGLSISKGTGQAEGMRSRAHLVFAALPEAGDRAFFGIGPSGLAMRDANDSGREVSD